MWCEIYFGGKFYFNSFTLWFCVYRIINGLRHTSYFSLSLSELMLQGT